MSKKSLTQRPRNYVLRIRYVLTYLATVISSRSSSLRMKWSAKKPRSILPIVCGRTILCEKETSPPSNSFPASHVHREVDRRRLTERCAAKPTRKRASERARAAELRERTRSPVAPRAPRLFIRASSSDSDSEREK